MNKAEVKEKVEHIIVSKLGLDPSEIIDNASLGNDYGADSLEAIELIMEFEKEFNIGITDDEVDHANPSGDIRDLKVNQLIDLVWKKVETK